jgi:hypothetical protein
VLVEENGQTRRVPIRDVTRLAQIGLLAVMALLMLAGRRRALQHKE